MSREGDVGAGCQDWGWRRPPKPPLPPAPWQAFLLKLVQNLFAEGNDLFREKDYKQALVQYMEGLNVADYAASDQVALPQELLCKLHVNRAACYFTMVSLVSSLPLLRPRPDHRFPQLPSQARPMPREPLQGRLLHLLLSESHHPLPWLSTPAAQQTHLESFQSNNM